ncbi:HMA2 domain-containing protein [Richelia sinica]|uniref:HMA2 domain-containing protein n=1 Tax=Richelia sinica TaxID=1357545 RepID=UPI0036F217B0
MNENFGKPARTEVCLRHPARTEVHRSNYSGTPVFWNSFILQLLQLLNSCNFCLLLASSFFPTTIMVIIPHQPQITQPGNPYTPIATKVVSQTPGRLRLRISRDHRQPEKMQHIANFLQAQPHITEVRTNFHHGSILIHHYDTSGSLADVLATLQDIGIIFADITQGTTEAATGVTSAVLDLNQRVELATNGVIDLRFLFPLGLSVLAVRQLMLKGLQLEVIPWYVLAWYAFDSFLKLNHVNQYQLASSAQTRNFGATTRYPEF